ncbi:Rossmann-like and DUF2520 domain-containing protein [Trueperella pyogenes]|uniref:Rossmann-like and DUF2520 domain-containing protein n=1 Tax=Trueperella pyogenes TaxID=1661 RepID=UPI00345D8969
MENSTGRMGVGIISAGRVGTALGSALRAAGHTVIGAHAPSPDSRERLEVMLPGVPALDVETIVERSELVILALPDAEIGPLVQGLASLELWQPGQIVIHTSPRCGTEILTPAQAAGALTLALHPVMDFSGTSMDVARLAGARVVVSAANAIQPIGLALAAEMGAEGVVVNSADRPIYAAALAHARDGVSLAASQAGRALAEIGVSEPGRLLAPWASAGLEHGLARQRHCPPEPGESAERLEALQTLAAESPQLADVAESHRQLLATLVTRAVANGAIDEAQANELHTIIAAVRR